MALYEDFQKRYRELATLPSSERAVRSTGGLLGSYARENANRQLNDINTGTRRMAVENQLANQRADIRSAKTDVGIALPLTVANVGIQGKTAYERIKMQKEQEQHNRQVEDFWNAAGAAQAKHFDEIIGILFPQLSRGT